MPPSAKVGLTTIDVRDPGRPVVTSRIPFHEAVRLAYGYQRALASDGRWLLEAEALPAIWNVYDLANPAHPIRRRRVPITRVGAQNFGQLLYGAWRHGVLEFRTVNGGFEALRYLTDGGDSNAEFVAAADGYVYLLKEVKDRRFVSAYKVN